ncbi:MAG: amino acid adenylation domain-containing protein [Peptococcaceae bacterium]|nr:amino acid adenylation domain-containing protein [Peptococcaceae bacterium]
MNSYQEGFCRVDEILGANAVNKFSCVINFKREVDVEVMRNAIELTTQNAYLRKKIDSGGTPYTDNDHVNELSKVIRFAGSGEIHEYINQRKREPISWQDAYLIGFEILVYAEEVRLYCWFHHLMYDGLSSHRTLDTLIENYCCLLRRKEALTDFDEESLAEAAAYATSEHYEGDKAFWRTKNEKARDVKTVFQTDITETESERVQEYLGRFLTKKIEKYCQEHGLTMPIFFLAVTAILVRPYFVSEDICLGVSLHNRKRHQINKLGMVLNTLPFILEQPEEEMFSAFCQRVNLCMSEIYRYRAYPQKDIGFTPQVLFSYQINSFESDAALFQCDWLFSNETTIPLAISVNDIHKSGDRQVIMDHRVADISGSQARFLVKKFVELCQMLTGDDCAVYPDPALTPLEQGLLDGLNQTKKAYPLDQSVTDIFAKTVQAQASKVAVQFREQKLTYAELDHQAGKVADFLASRGIGAKDVVAVVFEKSVEIVCALWGVMKAGAVYLPMDPQWPQDRMDTVCRLAQAKCVITNVAMVHDTIPVIPFSEIGNSWGSEDTQKAPPARSAPKRGRKDSRKNSLQDPLYVLFTSGTTGVPKGVCVSHRNIINLAQDEAFAISREDRFLQIINSTFDVSVMGYIVALMNGATLVIAEDRIVLDPGLTADLVKSENISMLNTTTPLLNQWLPYLASFTGVKSIMTGGEKMTASTANQVVSLLKGKLINAYGPTETTVFSTVQAIDKSYETDVPIGRPISNTMVYIVDKAGARCSVNQTGELWIGGDGVSLGYLNNEEETRKCFAGNPFGEGAVYKTGDLCLINEQGVLEYKGRMDDQIKIRGYRIETSEIENALRGMAKVENAAIAVENNRIIAYIVTAEDKSVADVARSLRNKLPNYMIPSVFREVREIPLSSNGKIDRKAISQYVVRNYRMDSPEDTLSDTEKTIKTVFSETLGIPQLGLYDNFFSMGGTSIDAMKVVTEVNERFSLSIKVADFYKNSSIEALAGLVSLSGHKPGTKISEVTHKKQQAEAVHQVSTATCPATPAQSMLFSIWNMDPNATTYNIPVLIQLKRDIRISRLEACLTELVERHEALRSRIVFDANNEIVQEIDDPYEVKLIRKKYPTQKGESFVTPFDLSHGYPFRASLLRRRRHRYLLLDFHHCFIDGASVELLLKDLEGFYYEESFSSDPYSYAEYAWRLSGQDTRESAVFWQQVLRDAVPANIDLRVNRNKLSEGSTGCQTPGVHEYSLKRTLTGLLRDLAKEKGVSLQNYLLACFTVLLSKYDNEGKVAIGTILSGRTGKTLNNAVGMYVNTIPVVFDVDSAVSVEDHINSVVNYLAEAYDHQSFGFNNIVGVSGAQRDSSRNPIFDIMFMIQNVTPSTRLGELADEIQVQEKFDATVEVSILEEAISVRTTYKKDLFDALAIELLGLRFQKVLYQIVNNDAVLIQDISMVTELDTHLLSQYNQKEPTRGKLPTVQTVSQCMAETARKYSRRKAVIKGDRYLTYKKLYANAKKIAAALQKQGCGRNDIVGLCAVRSLEMIEAIWGIVLAGAAYLPIDDEIPKVRMEYMLRECNAKLVITFGVDCSIVPEGYLTMDVLELKKAAEAVSHTASANSAQDLLYVMYTSGSTGNPKGVQTNHLNVLEYIHSVDENKSGKYMTVSNYAFDGSVYDLFVPFLNGGSVTVLDKEESMDPSCIAQTVSHEKINYLFLPTALFNHLSDDDLKKMTSIKRINTGGEKASPTRMKKAVACLPGKIYNVYGPTEATVWCASHQVTVADVETDIPIGKPYDLAKFHILDEKNGICPVGIVGQIAISGGGVSKGYVNSPERTQFGIDVDTGERTYNTGDNGRWNTGGILEYVGRKDSQVKFRGFRIELEEIRQKILGLENIEDAVVLVLEKNQNRELHAYYVPRDLGVTRQKLDEYLKRNLPEYMVPRFYAEIDHMPLTRNGKIDKAKLELIPTIAYESSAIEEPHTDAEKRIAEIWRMLFNREISRYDDFFELGGHSIQAIRFVSEMKKDGIDLSIKDVMDHSSLIALAKHIDQHESNQLRLISTKRKAFHLEPHAVFHKMSHHSDSRALFVFPTYMLNIAYMMTFSKMSEMVRSHSLYLGDFTNSKDYVREFAKSLVRESKKYREIWLLGYSFGGCLAYEVAKQASAQGMNIKGIIMLDSFFKTRPDTGVDSHADELRTPEGLRGVLEERFDFYRELDLSTKESIEVCFLGFMEHSADLINSKEILNTTIHYLRGEHQEHDVVDTRDEWWQGCAESIQSYPAYGYHNNLLDVANMARNVHIINDILSHGSETDINVPKAEIAGQ